MSNFGCCGGNRNKEKVVVADRDKLDVILATPNVGQRYIYGGVTKTRYGYFGQGDLILGVAKDDIRSRPSWFVCANCRGEFVVTRTDVYCTNCTNIADLSPISAEKFVERIAKIQPPAPPPPPEPAQSDTSPISETLYEIDEWALDDPEIMDIDYGNKVNKRHKKILAEAGIVTLSDAESAGLEGLTAVKGIGEAIANTILATKFEQLDYRTPEAT